MSSISSNGLSRLPIDPRSSNSQEGNTDSVEDIKWKMTVLEKQIREIPDIKAAINQAKKEGRVVKISRKTSSIFSDHNNQNIRSISITSDGQLYLHLNGVIGTGAEKTVKKIIKLSTGEIFAKKSSNYSNAEEKQKIIKEAFLSFRLPDIVLPKPDLKTFHNRRINETESRYVYFEELMIGDMESCQNLINSENILPCAEQMAFLVSSYHKVQILHRDIKPQNFFVKEIYEGVPVLRLGDVGEATNFDDTDNKMKPCGTALYSSPEYIRALSCKPRGESLLGALTVKSESWSLGLSMLRIFKNELSPFIETCPHAVLIKELLGITKNERISQIQTDVAELTEENWFPRPNERTLEFVIYNLLRINPDDRWTAEQAAGYLHSLSGENSIQETTNQKEFKAEQDRKYKEDLLQATSCLETLVSEGDKKRDSSSSFLSSISNWFLNFLGSIASGVKGML